MNKTMWQLTNMINYTNNYCKFYCYNAGVN